LKYTYSWTPCLIFEYSTVKVRRRPCEKKKKKKKKTYKNALLPITVAAFIVAADKAGCCRVGQIERLVYATETAVVRCAGASTDGQTHAGIDSLIARI